MIKSETNSALLSVEWDWSTDDRSRKQTTKQEAFKYSDKRFAQGGESEEDYPYDVIDTKLRIRGAGRTLKVRYESTEGKDFILLGHSVFGIDRNASESSK